MLYSHRSALRDENKNEVDLVSNVYNGSRRVVHGGQHDYDTIPDVLEQIQLQQLEIVRQLKLFNPNTMWP